MLLHVRLLFRHHAFKTVFWDKDSSFTWCHFFFFFASIQGFLIGFLLWLGTGVTAMTKSGWVFTSFKQNSKSEHWGLSYATMLRCTNASRWWKVTRNAFDEKIAGRWFRVACESCLLLWLFSLLTDWIFEEQARISFFAAPRNTEMRETKIYLVAAKNKTALNFQDYTHSCQQGLMFVKVEIRSVRSIMIRRMSHMPSFSLSKEGCFLIVS